MYEGNLIIFGGDRHHFTFCDTFVFDLAAAMRAKGLDVWSYTWVRKWPLLEHITNQHANYKLKYIYV